MNRKIASNEVAEALDKLLGWLNLPRAGFVVMAELADSGSMPWEQLIHQCSKPWFEDRPDWCLNQRQAERMASDLLRRGLIAVVSKPFQQSVVRLLKQRKVMGPTAGMPKQGHIEITTLGAQVVRKIDSCFQQDPEDWKACRLDLEPGRVLILGTTKQAVTDFKLSDNELIVAEGEIKPIAKWCDRWWREYPSGFRQDVTIQVRND